MGLGSYVHTLSFVCPALHSCLRLSAILFAILFSILTVGSIQRSLYFCYIIHLALQDLQFCLQLMKAYMAETSCNQLFN